MGKSPYVAYNDSDETDCYMSSAENVKKKKKMSILKFFGNSKKKNYKVQSKSEPEECYFRSSRSSSPSSEPTSRSSEPTSRSSVPTSRSRSHSSTVLKPKLRGILKHTKRESSDEEDVEPTWALRSQGRCLVGHVPRPPGAKPGRGGGLAFVVRKNVNMTNLLSQRAASSKRRSSFERLYQKRPC